MHTHARTHAQARCCSARRLRWRACTTTSPSWRCTTHRSASACSKHRTSHSGRCASSAATRHAVQHTHECPYAASCTCTTCTTCTRACALHAVRSWPDCAMCVHMTLWAPWPRASRHIRLAASPRDLSRLCALVHPRRSWLHFRGAARVEARAGWKWVPFEPISPPPSSPPTPPDTPLPSVR